VNSYIDVPHYLPDVQRMDWGQGLNILIVWSEP